MSEDETKRNEGQGMPAMAPAINSDERVAFGKRLSPFIDPLFGFASGRAYSRDNALEALQESLAAALKGFEEGKRWEDDESIWAWLVNVCRNKIVDQFRRNNRQAKTLTSLGIDPEQLANTLLDGKGLPAELAAKHEVGELCRTALSELIPRQRLVLEGFYEKGLSQKELADRLNLSVKAVESLMARARQTLRDILERMVNDKEELL